MGGDLRPGIKRSIQNTSMCRCCISARATGPERDIPATIELVPDACLRFLQTPTLPVRLMWSTGNTLERACLQRGMMTWGSPRASQATGR